MDEKAKQFGDAVSALLDAIEANERSRRTTSQDGFKAYRLDEYIAAEEAGDFYLADPVGYGLRKGIRKAGKLLAKQYPLSVARDVAEYAATKGDPRSGTPDADTMRFSRRADIVDKHWDGITTPDGDVWVA